MITKLGLRGVEDLPINYDLKELIELFDQQELLTAFPSPRQLSSEQP